LITDHLWFHGKAGITTSVQEMLISTAVLSVVAYNNFFLASQLAGKALSLWVSPSWACYRDRVILLKKELLDAEKKILGIIFVNFDRNIDFFLDRSDRLVADVVLAKRSQKIC
jgi:hypothetical protein